MNSSRTDVLRISPKFTTDDWSALNSTLPKDWDRAAQIVKDRLDGRFPKYAGNCLRSPDSGFVVLAINSLLIETLQKFRDGVVDGRNKSKEMIVKFLRWKRFQPYFYPAAQDAYYSDIRCGLLHQAEAKQMWFIGCDRAAMLEPSPRGDGYIIDVRQFHNAVRSSMNDYLRDLRKPANDELRSNLWTKMNHLANVRRERGLVYELE